MDEVYSWLKNIVIYMILNTIIMNLLGNSSYKKYVSIVSGMILVLIVISPIMNFMDLDDNFEFFFRSNDFAVETSDFKNSLYHMEQQQSDVVFTEYQNRIRQQVEELLLDEGIYLVSFDVTLDRDVRNETFGEIHMMNITASYESNEAKVSSSEFVSMDGIEEIEITKIDLSGEEENEIDYLPLPMEINLKNKLSDFYNIEPVNINISIQGG